MKTNRLIAFTLCFGVLLPLAARHLSPEEALERAKSGFTDRMQVRSTRMDSTPLLRVKAQKQSDLEALYVFNGSDGFMVVSAYDNMPALLAYSDNPLNEADIAPGFSYWLDFYADQIEYAVTNGLQGATAQESWPSISPIVKAKWNQGSPYNQDCPTINNRATQTGCVATAMAQILNVYKYPDNCQGGSLKYTTTTSLSLSINFNDVAIDWANILDSYGSGSGPGGSSSSATTEQKNAIANLMMACGYATHMNYNTGESTT